MTGPCRAPSGLPCLGHVCRAGCIHLSTFTCYATGTPLASNTRRIRVKAWRKPNEDGASRPYVDPDVWARDVGRFVLVPSTPYCAAYLYDQDGASALADAVRAMGAAANQAESQRIWARLRL